MDFTAWTTSGKDPVRRKRLALGYAVGTVGALCVGAIVAATASQVVMQADEEPLTVALATTPEPEPEPEPEPQPEPEPDPQPKVQNPGPRLPSMKPPDEVPDDKPAESEPTDSDNPYGSGDPYALGGGSGLPPATKAVVEPPPPPPPPPPKPKPRGPIRVSENVTPPSCSIGTPAYPESARSSGIQGTVIVKYVVTESGAITSVQVMRGPAELRAVSAAAVQNAHCTPARLDGAPVSVYRIARFPFRLKT